MFAMFLIVLVATTILAATGVLADSGLRWWSAFGQLRRELKLAGPAPVPSGMRPAHWSAGGNAAAARANTATVRYDAMPAFRRAA